MLLLSLIDGEEDVDDGVVERLLLLLLFAGVLLLLLVVLGDSDAPLIGVPGLLLLLVIMLVVELLVFANVELLFMLFASEEAISSRFRI